MEHGILLKEKDTDIDVGETLNNFIPVDLGVVGTVSLMDRVDTKFIFPLYKLPVLLEIAKAQFKVLDINSKRTHRYSTIYLDTGNYDFYYRHVTGRLPRYKVRFRTYEQTDQTYLEIKHSTKKGRTVKSRIESRMNGAILDKAAINFINDNNCCNSAELNPVLKNSFSRITLLGMNLKERVTIDYNLSYFNGGIKSVNLPFLAIAELKKEESSHISPFTEIIKKLEIRPTGFSKYCLGSILMNDMFKANSMKSKLLLIKKIENEYYKSAFN